MTGLARRILALDLGDARIGLALSDPLRITAQPIGYVRRVGQRKVLDQIRELVQHHDVERVVVGNPLLLSGEPGPRSREAEGFSAQLRKRLGDVAVELWDERLTTVQAERAMISHNVRRRRRRQVVDSLAAVLILQSYLDAAGTGEEKPRS